MKIDKQRLVSRITRVAKDLDISPHTAYPRFFFDCFLARLASSPLREKYVLKGGLCLSSLVGIAKRSTLDIDFLLWNADLTHERTIGDMKEIAAMDIDDGVYFEYIMDKPIRQDDPYGGFGIQFMGRFANIRQVFSIDIATGDPMVPGPKLDEYDCLITGEKISLLRYPIETILAEKLETILEKGVKNSRSKDFYDVYLLRKEFGFKIDADLLKEAFSKTCAHRGFPQEPSLFERTLRDIRTNENQKARWARFLPKSDYATGISFEETADAVSFWLHLMGFDSL